MMVVKTLSGATELYREGPHARSSRRGASVAERARRVHVDSCVARTRALDHEHSRQADGTPYPGVREQVQRLTPRRPRARGAASLGPRAWSAWRWWAPTRAAARRYMSSRARWRRGGRAPSGGRWARRASTRRWGSSCMNDVLTCTTAVGAACSGGRGRASSEAACPSSGGRTPRSSTTASRPRTRAADASGRWRGGAVAAGVPRLPGIMRGARAAAGP